MILTGKNIDKFVATILYLALLCFVLWGGARLINRSLESKFYKDYLMKWDIAVMTYSLTKATWPQFTGGNHVDYMDSLISAMAGRSVTPPASNTTRPYIYQIKKIGASEETIFLLCFSDRIILYGISEKTFSRIDTYIDGKTGRDSGKVTGNPSKDGRTYIALWHM